MELSQREGILPVPPPAHSQSQQHVQTLSVGEANSLSCSPKPLLYSRSPKSSLYSRSSPSLAAQAMSCSSSVNDLPHVLTTRSCPDSFLSKELVPLSPF